MIQAMIILLALILGYFINIKILSNQTLNRLLSSAISLIIFVMGYDFGYLTHQIVNQLWSMITIVSTFIVGFFVINALIIKIFFTIWPKHQIDVCPSLEKVNRLKPILQSCKYLLYLALGTLLGMSLQYSIKNIAIIIDGILVITLFVVGVQMRREGHSLTQILKNKTGMIIATLLIISTLLTGMIIGWIYSINTPYALMLSSGFGWYSLSSILNAQLIDAHYGTMTFFIDFSREIIAIIFIPILAKKMPSGLIGYSGATSMDFTLPVIKNHIGMHAVPVAISSGFILTIATPILIPLFNLLT